MTRYIDADALRDKLQNEIDKGIPPYDDVMGAIRCGVRLARNIVEDEPTVDAVPVIRCKDCKHWACDDSESYCDELGIFNTGMNSYCSYAKRKEE